MQYIPSRIDSVLDSLNKQAEFWQRESQNRQKLGVEMYELGLKSNRSDLMEQGVNMIEKRDTLARPFTPNFSFNYEGSGEKRQEMTADPAAVKAQMDARYKPQNAQEANAFIASSLKSNPKEAEILKADPLKYMQMKSGQVDFSGMMQNKDEWNKFMSDLSYVSTDKSLVSGARSSDEIMDGMFDDLESKNTYRPSNPYMPNDRDEAQRPTGIGRTEFGEPAGGIQSSVKGKESPFTEKQLKANEDQARKSIYADRDAAYKKVSPQIQAHKKAVDADAKRFVNESAAYKTAKERVDATNKVKTQINERLNEIDRKITSKDGQVRADGYREFFEYELDKAGDDYTSREKAARKFINNMTHLGLHYDDPVLAQGMRVDDLIGKRSGPGVAKKEDYTVQIELPDGTWEDFRTVGIDKNVEDKDSAARRILGKNIPEGARIRVSGQARTSKAGLEDVENDSFARGAAKEKMLKDVERKINNPADDDSINTVFNTESNRREAAEKYAIEAKRKGLIIQGDASEGYKVVRATHRDANGDPYILLPNPDDPSGETFVAQYYDGTMSMKTFRSKPEAYANLGKRGERR